MRWCLVGLLFLAACQQPQQDLKDVQEVEVEDIPEDIRVPQDLWDKAIGLDEKSEASDEDTLAGKETILFAPVTVILTEHNPKVLENSQIRILLPRGGGKVDLSDFIGSQPGSFFVRFEFPEWQELGPVRSFYVGRTKKRKLDGEIYGIGCNKYVNISQRMQDENAHQGIKVNTTRNRHTTVLGGHFVFSVKKNNDTFLTQVTFVDSKNSDLYCDNVKVQ